MSFGNIKVDDPVSKKPSGCGIGCLSVIVIVVVIVLIAWLSSNSPEKSAEHDAELTSVLSERACQRSVEAQLKAPATAKFSGVSATGTGANRTVTGSVDAENSFGALIRNSFKCEVSVINESASVTSVSIS